MWTRPLWLTLALLITTALSTTAFGAGEDAAMDFSWGGFVSQGLVYTDDHNFAGKSDDGVSTDYREAAVYAMWRPVSQVRIGGQLTTRKLGSMVEDDLQWDYLSVDINLYDSGSDTFGARLGKLKLNHGLYNTSREVPFARDSILLPQSMYTEETRDIQQSAMGGELYGSQYLSDYRLDYSLFYGHLRHDYTAEVLFFRDRISGHFNGSETFVGNVGVSSSNDQWRLSLTAGKFTPSFKAGPLNEMGMMDGDIDVRLYAIGAEYNLEHVSFSAEYFRHYLEYKDLGGVFLNADERVFEAYYAQANWRFAPSFNLFLRYDVTHRDAYDKNGRKAAATLGVPAHSMWSKDWSMGLGWRFNPNWIARAEFHNIQGTGRVPVADNDPSDANPNWNMVLFQLAYRF